MERAKLLSPVAGRRFGGIFSAQGRIAEEAFEAIGSDAAQSIVVHVMLIVLVQLEFFVGVFVSLE